jgi:hypothetical protein
LNRSLDRNPNKDNVVNLTEPTSGVKYNVYNDRMPQYYTSFDDKTITLDAWDSRQSNTIMEEYTVCYGLILPEFKLEDTFVPDLAPQHFNLLLNSARVQAAYELNREQDTLVNDRARKELVTADKHAQRVRGIETTLWKNRPKSGRRI